MRAYISIGPKSIEFKNYWALQTVISMAIELKKTRRASSLMVLLLGGLSGCGHLPEMFLPAGEETPLQQLASQAVKPAYEHWVQQSRALQQQTQQFCANDTTLEGLRTAWRDDMQAWAGLQSMQPGPVTATSVRVAYWPDKKDLVGHQVSQWLQAPAPTAETLSHMSVTLQGLSALEYLLFAPGLGLDTAPQDARYPAKKEQLCPYIQVIADRQQQLSEQVLQQWQSEQGAALMNALPNARYASESEALAELLKANVSGLEIAHKKLTEPLGDKYPQPFLAEYWRSGASLLSTRAVLEGSQTLWHAGLDAKVKGAEASLATRIDQAYDKLLNSELLTASLTVPLADVLVSTEGRSRLDNLAREMKALHLLYAREISLALRIPLGINANDGD